MYLMFWLWYKIDDSAVLQYTPNVTMVISA